MRCDACNFNRRIVRHDGLHGSQVGLLLCVALLLCLEIQVRVASVATLGEMKLRVVSRRIILLLSHARQKRVHRRILAHQASEEVVLRVGDDPVLGDVEVELEAQRWLLVHIEHHLVSSANHEVV